MENIINFLRIENERLRNLLAEKADKNFALQMQNALLLGKLDELGIYKLSEIEKILNDNLIAYWQFLN